jgi:hypothetical protein
MERMLDRYQVRGAKIAEVVIDLASRPAGPEWLSAHVGRLKASVPDVLIMESEASIIHAYGVQVVPHLVRAEPYAHHFAPHLRLDCDVDDERDLPNSRQRYRAGGRRRILDVMIDERALTLQLTEPQVMVAQLRHWLELSLSQDTAIRVVPNEARFYEARAYPFDLLECPEVDDRLTLVHTILGTDFGPGDLTDLWHLIEPVHRCLSAGP